MPVTWLQMRHSECSARRPQLRHPIEGRSLSRDLRERASAEERRFLLGLSLLANFGVTLNEIGKLAHLVGEKFLSGGGQQPGHFLQFADCGGHQLDTLCFGHALVTRH
jgi:hypothetical protein